MTGADLTGALVAGAFLGGITREQLYSTASYQAKDLRGIGMTGNDLSGWDLRGQNLSNAYFLGDAKFTGVDLTGADLRNARLPLAGPKTNNAILGNGDIQGLSIDDGERLVFRDYDGGSFYDYPIERIPIYVLDTAIIAPCGLLQMVFEADDWGSTISFEPGIPVQLGGALELTFANGVDVATQVGRTLHVFDWTGVEPMGTFTLTSPYLWDLSELYSTGEVRLTGTGSAGDYDGGGIVDQADLDLVLIHWGTDSAMPPAGWGNDLPIGPVDQDELDKVLLNWGSAPSALATTSVPEPSAAAILVMGILLLSACCPLKSFRWKTLRMQI
jgi:uncharacterized protein YjbI with pentapeptide repeats